MSQVLDMVRANARITALYPGAFGLVATGLLCSRDVSTSLCKSRTRKLCTQYSISNFGLR